jgi:ribosomal protein L27
MGKDHTRFATIEGYVKFENVSRDKKRVSVNPERH